MPQAYRRTTITRTFLLALALVFAATATGADAAPPERAKKVLIIGIDGVRVDALEQARTPVMDGLARDGVLADNVRIQGDRYHGSNTVSGPGWSSILTGVWADKHGVDDNTFKSPRLDRFPHVFARIKAADPGAETISLVSWTPIDTHIVVAADISRVIAGPRAESAQPAAIALAEAGLDSAMREAAAALLESRDPAAMFVYFHQADAAGHTIGFDPRVRQYIRAIENIDGEIGGLVEAIRNRQTYDGEDWLILITTDHGGVGRRHGGRHGDPRVERSFVIANSSEMNGRRLAGQVDIVDVVPTVLHHLGIPVDPGWQLDGQALTEKAK